LASSQLTTTLTAQEDKLLACIHCGLCLEACPTYVATGDENDSPRGRIYLMRAVQEGKLGSDSVAFERHIDRCLGCRACELVCPAGVEYGQLLEAARAELAGTSSKRGLTYQLLRFVLRHVWLQPARLKFALAIARVLRDAGVARLLLKLKVARIVSQRFEFALALLENSSPGGAGTSAALEDPKAERLEPSQTDNRLEPASVRARHPSGGASDKECAAAGGNPALLFRGCISEGLFSHINRATARVLEVNGIAVSIPHGQVCCGALHAHAGDLEGARQLARKNIEAFGQHTTAPIITNAGGCGAMLISYGHLFASDQELADRAREFSARVRDVSQQLDATDIKQGANIGASGLTYDASCHLIYGQHAGETPVKMLQAIPNLNFVPLPGSESCCGGAGVYNLLESELSRRVLNEKLACIRRTGASVLATGNPGCQMQIAAGALLAGMRLRVCHPVELLDESYRRAGFYG
jgi:glycolate dehydrogenase iron-sulfur subunit